MEIDIDLNNPAHIAAAESISSPEQLLSYASDCVKDLEKLVVIPKYADLMLRALENYDEDTESNTPYIFPSEIERIAKVLKSRGNRRIVFICSAVSTAFKSFLENTVPVFGKRCNLKYIYCHNEVAAKAFRKWHKAAWKMIKDALIKEEILDPKQADGLKSIKRLTNTIEGKFSYDDRTFVKKEIYSSYPHNYSEENQLQYDYRAITYFRENGTRLETPSSENAITIRFTAPVLSL